MRIRPATIADVPAIMRLERQSAGAAHWSAQQYDKLFLAASFRAKNDPVRSESFAWVVEDEPANPEQVPGEIGEPLAFLVAQRIDADWELENMAVAPAVRRRGIGSLLLNELIAQAIARGANKIFLEVRPSNHSARALYRKLGFDEIGLRKGYYSDPSEDAIICGIRLQDRQF